MRTKAVLSSRRDGVAATSVGRVGDGPGQLALALTRARRKLVLLGDPGTLVRRGQWEGTVDHLDASASARERELVGRLVGYLEGTGPHAGAFLLREGSGP